jgi:hypothetical protein
LTLSIPFLIPAPPEVKLKSNVQLDPATKLAPHVLLVTAKSLPFVPVIGVPAMFNVLPLKFASVAVSGPLVIPKSSLGGVKLIFVWQPARLTTVGLSGPPLEGTMVPAPMKLPIPGGLKVNCKLHVPPAATGFVQVVPLALMGK